MIASLTNSFTEIRSAFRKNSRSLHLLLRKRFYSEDGYRRSPMYKTVVLLPAYCPEESLIPLCQQLNDSVSTVVVNDGSPSRYQELFDRLSEHTVILAHEKNQGKGAALKTGMRYIQETYGDCIVVTADADGQHLYRDILSCAKEAALHPDHLVLGVRDFSGKDVPIRSSLGNRITSLLFLLFTGRHLSDTQTGLRAFSSSMIPLFLETEGNRYEYEMNQLLRAVSKKIPFHEVRIETVYLDGNSASHYRPFRDSLLILRQFLMFSLSSLTGFLIDYTAFLLLSSLFPGSRGILISNVIARILSASCNFEMNRRIVFRSDQNWLEGFLRYLLLACLILFLNTGVLYLLTQGFHIRPWLAKLLCEMILFLFSWTIQKKFVFADETKGVTAL